MRVVRVFGKKYWINPSLRNMCLVEEETGHNLAMGVPVVKQDLRFVRAVVSNLLETEAGDHVPDEILEQLFLSDASMIQKIFVASMNEMYVVPPTNGGDLPKKRVPRILEALRRLLNA